MSWFFGEVQLLPVGDLRSPQEDLVDFIVDELVECEVTLKHEYEVDPLSDNCLCISTGPNEDCRARKELSKVDHCRPLHL